MLDVILHELFNTGLGIYIVTLYGAALLGWLQLAHRNQTPAIGSPAVIGLILLIAVPSVLQLLYFPELLDWLRRDADLILHHGEIWRLLTAVLVQGGSYGGIVFNLVALALLAPITGQLYGARRMLLLFLVGTLSGELAALFISPVGAGNSVGNFGLAAGIIVATLWRSSLLMRVSAGLIALTCCVAFSWLDIHAFAFAGCALFAIWLFRHPVQ